MDRKLRREEEKLAKKVKKLCLNNGRETDLVKTGKLFHKMANIMRERSDDLTCYVQSTIMYHAALLRDTANTDEIKADLQRLCAATLRRAGVKSKHPTLLELSQQTMENVKEFREKVGDKLKEMLVITEDAKGVELKNLEERKLAQVEEVQNMVTAGMISVMSETIKACMALLGKPPCEFVIVGIGTLARNEITPYSLFEYIITLQRGSHQRRDTKRVQKYFHWFTTFFNMTIVNLGETEASNGAIPSIRDLKNCPNEGLVDTVVTPGLSFPGLMSMPWMLSPDMPFVEMLKVTDKPNNASARYTMTENLTKTCYVYGNGSLYADYENTVCKQIWRTVTQTPHANLVAQLSNEMKHIQSLECLGSKKISDAHFDPLYIINQGTTVLTYALGRLYNVQAVSNYGIVNELLRSKLVAEKYAYQLKYFISVANEMRLKMCLKYRKRVRDEVSEVISDEEIANLFDAVGKKSLVEYFWTAWCLFNDLSQWLRTGDRESLCTTAGFFSKYGGIVYAKTCFYLRLYDDCIKQCKLQLQKPGNPYANAFRYLLGCAYERQGKCVAARDSFESLVRQLELRDQGGKYSSTLAHVMTRVGQCSLLMRAPADAVPSLLRALEKYRNINEEESHAYGELIVSLSYCYLELKRHEDILSLLHKPEEQYRSLVQNNKYFAVKLRIVIGLCMSEMRKGALGIDELEDAVDLSTRASENYLVDSLLAEALDATGKSYMGMGDYNKAWHHLQKNIGIEDRVIPSRRQFKSVHIASWVATVGVCLIKLKRWDEGKAQLERAIAMRKDAPSDLNLESYTARDLNHIASMFHSMGKEQEALETLQGIAQLERAVTRIDPYDFVVINAYHDMGTILNHMQCYDKAQKKFEKELNLIKKIPKVELPSPNEMAETFQMLEADYFQTASRRQRVIEKVLHPVLVDPHVRARRNEIKGGNYLQLANGLKREKRHMEALQLFKKSIKAITKADPYLPSENAMNYNHAVSGMGECLLALGRPEEALRLFNRSLWLSRQTTSSAGVDLQIRALHHVMRVCFKNLRKECVAEPFTPLVALQLQEDELKSE